MMFGLSAHKQTQFQPVVQQRLNRHMSIVDAVDATSEEDEDDGEANIR